MSQRRAKEARRKAEAENVLYQIVITVNADGGFELEVPKGASVPLTLDVLMRAQKQVWDTFLVKLNQQAAEKRMVQPIPSGRIPEGLLRRQP